jgi:conjugative relaxase-like TrwC/TraI family protein
MRFTITALGSKGGRTVGKVVGDIVRYLEPRTAPSAGTTTAPAVPEGEGPSSYYADRGTEAGRWLGVGAAESGLRGEVDADDFARVLAGRDPSTGRRLITASGSAGRRPTLGAGCATETAPDGTALYDIDDVAASLRVTRAEAEALVDAGRRRAMSAFLAATTGAGISAVPLEPEGSYVIPIVASDGSIRITGHELDRCEDARSLGVEAGAVAAGGPPDEQLSVAEAARLSGVTARYIRSVCRTWEDNRSQIEGELASDRTPSRAYLVAHRGTRNRWIVTRGELAAFLERRNAPAVRVGFDLTLTTEKSLGVLALLGDDHIRTSVLGAIQAGNDVGLAHLEYHATGARAKGKAVLGRGLTIASFRHLTSRALDPFPHHHNVVANSVVDETGARRALDARGLYQHAQGASALATIAMRHELTRTIGVSWRRGRSGSWEIDGIDDPVLREFSRRRNEIEDALAELEAEIGRRSTLDEVQSVITGSRPPKQDVDPATLVESWWDRARGHGLTPERLRSCTDRSAPARPINENAVFTQLASATEGVCAGHSLFTRSDVLIALADLDHYGQPLPLSASDAERLADGFLDSDHVLQLDTSGLRGALGRSELFTTREILDVQRRIATWFDDGLQTGSAQVSSERVRHALGSYPNLIDEQRALVLTFCASGHRLQCAIGRAGAGKTTTMRAAAEAWTAAGYSVLGAAVKGEAARHLAAGAGIPTETVAWYLARADSPPLDERTVLIIDEASTLADRDLDRLLHMAERSGATVRLIGDPDQHGAVAAGGMFRYLCATHPEATPELATAHRVLGHADREAARLLRDGQPHEALAVLSDAGHLHIADNDVDLYVGMLHNWWEAHRNGEIHPMVDRRHHTRRVLNRLARQLIRANGELGPTELEASGGRRFATGDRVVARMVARDLHVDGDPAAYVRNGATGTVVAVHDVASSESDGLDVDFEGIGTIRLPRYFVDEHAGPGGRMDVGVDHAYAVTSYAVQGATFERSTSRIDVGATRSETYVDITRGRHANHLFLTRAPDPLDGEHLPKAPDTDLPVAVSDRLRRSGPERVALELPTVPRGGPPRVLPEVLPDAWSSRIAVTRSDPIHLRRRHDNALRHVLDHRSRSLWVPGDSSPWEWALGVETGRSNDFARRGRAQERLDELAITIALEQLAPFGVDDEWATAQVISAIAAGAPASSIPHLARVVAQVAQFNTSEPAGPDAVVPLAQVLRQIPFDQWLVPTIEPPGRPPPTLGR